jgi:hypothetical protein
MKISHLIREGSKNYKQGFNEFYSRCRDEQDKPYVAVCAVGAAFIGAGVALMDGDKWGDQPVPRFPSSYDNPIAGEIWKELDKQIIPSEIKALSNIDCFHKTRPYRVLTVITELNDYCKWSIDQIADVLEKIKM